MNRIELSEYWQDRCWENGAMRVRLMAEGKLSKVKCVDLEVSTSVERQAVSKMCEVACCLWLGADPELMHWGEQPDPGYDVVDPIGRRIDVKGIDYDRHYLVSPLTWNNEFSSLNFDRFVLVKADPPWFEICRTISKREFHEKHHVAGVNHILRPGTWHMHEQELQRADRLNAWRTALPATHRLFVPRSQSQ